MAPELQTAPADNRAAGAKAERTGPDDYVRLESIRKEFDGFVAM